jgi:hypothetical protein
VVAGLVEEAQLTSAAVVPSERRQVTLRAWVTLAEHVLLEALHAPVTQL